MPSGGLVNRVILSFPPHPFPNVGRYLSLGDSTRCAFINCSDFAIADVYDGDAVGLTVQVSLHVI